MDCAPPASRLRPREADVLDAPSALGSSREDPVWRAEWTCHENKGFQTRRGGLHANLPQCIRRREKRPINMAAGGQRASPGSREGTVTSSCQKIKLRYTVYSMSHFIYSGNRIFEMFLNRRLELV
ncbi:hypothetical protein EYF80_010145 [Liparis tanakae]|uniref:Uncharacterized protein n=1 Tax=Liparis tanakae TaxID=230148 RepID=A0A4Z2IQW3_9TELE|nr:hypothetical protein EYF80_010145 [Liparis tanakae]